MSLNSFQHAAKQRLLFVGGSMTASWESKLLSECTMIHNASGLMNTKVPDTWQIPGTV